jgi:hypothetical protein
MRDSEWPRTAFYRGYVGSRGSGLLCLCLVPRQVHQHQQTRSLFPPALHLQIPAALEAIEHLYFELRVRRIYMQLPASGSRTRPPDGASSAPNTPLTWRGSARPYSGQPQTRSCSRPTARIRRGMTCGLRGRKRGALEFYMPRPREFNKLASYTATHSYTYFKAGEMCAWEVLLTSKCTTPSPHRASALSLTWACGAGTAVP